MADTLITGSPAGLVPNWMICMRYAHRRSTLESADVSALSRYVFMRELEYSLTYPSTLSTMSALTFPIILAGNKIAD
jgi:hypothetical protein